MKTYVFAIRTSDGSWFTSNGLRGGCLQTLCARFPTTFFDTKEEASKKIDEIMRYFPNEGVSCSIVSIKYTIREVYV